MTNFRGGLLLNADKEEETERRQWIERERIDRIRRLIEYNRILLSLTEKCIALAAHQ
ncbi:hypothetical protein PGB90_008979 [Kerria lacca]